MGRVWAAGVLSVACVLWGCGKSSSNSTPPPTPAHAAGAQDDGVGKPPPDEAAPTPEPSPPEPTPVTEVAEPARPVIPESPVAGEIDGRAFEVAAVRRDGSTVVIRDGDGRSVTLVLFDDRKDVEVLGDVQFGDPQVFVRADPGQPPEAFVEGYRLIFDQEAGRLWLELPEGRGTIAGTFKLE